MSHALKICLLTLVVACDTACRDAAKSTPSTQVENSTAEELTQEEKVKRFVLEQLLNAFVNGAREPIDLELEAGKAQLEEGIEKFYAGKQRLVRYSLVGPPADGEQQVKLFFDDRTGGPLDRSTGLEETRRYRLIDTVDGVMIQRAR